MTTEPPVTASDRWDKMAAKVKRGRGSWVLVVEDAKVPRNDKVKAALERRGLKVEVTSRVGSGTATRRFTGVRTWARTI
jgi:hypothetical protein